MLTEILVYTFLVEAITLMSRASFGSVKEKYAGLKMRYKVRIHHGEVGLALLLLGYLFLDGGLTILVGWVLFLSDVLHHFVVLPLLIGKTEYR